MILIGSQALNHYVPLNRKMHDWDFIMTREELVDFHCEYYQYKVKETDYSILYDINGTIVEIRNPDHLDPTDEVLLSNPVNYVKKMNTPFGETYVVELAYLYDIKRSTAECIPEHKHQYDLKLMQDTFKFTNEFESQFYKKRLAETQQRTKKTNKDMYDFFHKYHIPEYVVHDRLHEMIADLLDLPMPTYVRTITGAVTTVPELYHKLTHEQKVSLMVEESIVLSLERWFIPQMIENGINYRVIDKFYNNNEAMPTYKILKHVNLVGLKGEADYVVQFGKDNFFEIEKEWIKAKEVIKAKGGFPDWFFQELFDLRKRYKNNENIATV
jgi:hypothetical protein